MKLTRKYRGTAVTHENVTYFIEGDLEGHKKSVIVQGVLEYRRKLYQDTFVISNYFFNKLARYYNSRLSIKNQHKKINLRTT